MCGITGFVDFKSSSNLEDLKRMVGSIIHRGPDDQGVEIYENNYGLIGFGQARLSIIDLSEGGHQPMKYNSLRIVFNGEIYNYKEIKFSLQELGHIFKTESDTEVILQSFERWGVEAVNKFIGMFAFVIYDEAKNEITIVRDRAGVKPLYYYWDQNVFLFGSELKSFHSHEAFKKIINKKAVKSFFKQIHHGYIKAPLTIFENTFKLESGKYLKLNLKSKEIKIFEYWDVLDFYKRPKLNIDYTTAKSELKRLLVTACEYRMISDVPVGVFLSGGYDSTVVTSILQTNRTNKIQTFTIGFEEGNNEAPYAKETSKYLGTDHHEHICTKKEAQEIIPTLPFFYDEPFADSSAIPTILVSKLARQSVTVALSADAGDEVFCGYTSYFDLNKYLSHINGIPNFSKPIISKIGKSIAHIYPNKCITIKHKISGLSDSLDSNQIKEVFNLYKNMNDLPNYYDELFNYTNNSENLNDYLDYEGMFSQIEVAMAVDYKGYLQDDILTKVDRATMSVSLEGREPLLDHRIVEFAAQLPFEYKLNNGNNGKRILKEIVHEYIPKEMLNRPKSGFSLPIYSWLRNDLSFLIDEYLNNNEIEKSGLFNSDFVLKRVNEFKLGKLHYTPFIWKILMFQMWYRHWMENKL